MEPSQSVHSQYRGSYGGLLWRLFVATTLSIWTLGIALPWSITLIYRWVVGNVQISGVKVRYSGTAGQLYKACIAPWLIIFAVLNAVIAAFIGYLPSNVGAFGPTVIVFIPMMLTLILAGAWFALAAHRALIAHTHYNGDDGQAVSAFGSSYGRFLGQHILFALRLLITFGIGLPWAAAHYMKWWSANATIDGRRLQYTARTSFLEKWVPFLIGYVVIQIASEVVGRIDINPGGLLALLLVSVLATAIFISWHAFGLSIIFKQVVARLSYVEDGGVAEGGGGVV